MVSHDINMIWHTTKWNKAHSMTLCILKSVPLLGEYLRYIVSEILILYSFMLIAFGWPLGTYLSNSTTSSLIPVLGGFVWAPSSLTINNRVLFHKPCRNQRKGIQWISCELPTPATSIPWVVGQRQGLILISHWQLCEFSMGIILAISLETWRYIAGPQSVLLPGTWYSASGHVAHLLLSWSCSL